MSEPQLLVRQRGAGGTSGKQKSKSPAFTTGLDDSTLEKIAAQRKAGIGPYQRKSEVGHQIACWVISILAFITRFWKITYPNSVVFDEVHFGKFASYYIQRTYFFDVHPPFAKLLFAFVGWLVGYDGHFLFDNIGDSYIENRVPYVGLRSFPALLSTFTVTLTYWIMWESGYSIPACVLASGLMLFDNAQVCQTRLILLDSTLIFSIVGSLYCYIRFYKERHAAFSRKWWKWLLLTGISLSCVISTKYVGLFTFFTVGAAVAIDLWNLLDIQRGLSMAQFSNHFVARAFGLIIVPLFFYLFWFQIHFAVLTRSGPGDDFMSPEFQETLSDNVMTLNSIEVNYYDIITIKHKDTKAFLHSHTDRYPLRYEDGRVSSQGQQVTGYPFNDTNNHWMVMPPSLEEEQQLGRPVQNGDLIKLHHPVTDTYLLSHDVASPYYPTNQEFTTISVADAYDSRHNDTLFKVQIEGKKSQVWRTMSGQFKLIHYPSNVAMWTHTKPLPDWGYKQQEINGNKNIIEKSNIWYPESIINLSPDDPRAHKEPKVVKTLAFWRKYLELQKAMFHHNNALTSSHPYASQPIHWPFLLRGVSFWTKTESREQIYFLGNPAGWWLTSSLLAVYAGIIGADQLTLRRGIDALDSVTRSRLYNSTGFFWIAWLFHYVPFFLMGRQLFLHHYLPAHFASCLVTGALVEFVFCIESLDDIPSPKDGKKKYKPRSGPTSTFAAWIATLVILAVVVGVFFFFAPLTYGSPGLSVEEVNKRKLIGYDLHFAK